VLRIHSFATDPDPAFHFDTDPDPAFQFDTDPDPTVLCGSGSLLFHRGNVPKSVLLMHLYVIFLVSRTPRTQTKDTFLNFPIHLILLCSLG
jgi:hypothetical protein